MCRVMEDMRNQSLQEGMKQGTQKAMRAAAKRMLAAGKYSLEEITEMVGLPLNEVKGLQPKQDA